MVINLLDKNRFNADTLEILIDLYTTSTSSEDWKIEYLRTQADGLEETSQSTVDRFLGEIRTGVRCIECAQEITEPWDGVICCELHEGE